MKKLKIPLSIIAYFLLGMLVLAAVGSIITNRPIFFTAISSDSMSPVFQRGDMVVVWPLAEETDVKENDIVIFSTDSGYLASQGWIIHRIVSGNPEEGYITKGDNNDYTDQIRREAPLIERDQMVSFTPTLGERPIVLPFVGYIALWFEGLQASPYLLPAIITILSILLGIQIIKDSPKKRKIRSSPIAEQLLFFLSGVTLMVALMVTMLMAGSVVNYHYEVVNEETFAEYQQKRSRENYILLGNAETTEVSDVSNSSFLPLLATVTTDNPNFTLSHEFFYLNQGDETNVTVDIETGAINEYDSTIFVGLFYPILPQNIIYRLASYNYYLSVVVVAAIPSMPLMLYPVLNSRLRNRSIRFFKKKFSKLKRRIPLIQ